MNVVLKSIDPVTQETIGVPWDFHCTCTHKAASHWYVIGTGRLISGRCHECPLEMDHDRCKEFHADNLLHLEMKQKEKESK